MHELKKAFRISFIFVFFLWMIKTFEVILDFNLLEYGILPRNIFGLPGILFSPFIHGGFVHLFSNSIPLLVLGTGMIYLYPKSSIYVLPIVYILGGLGVWLFARQSSHIGASGLVYGLAGFIFTSGLVRRDARAMALSLIVVFLYGGMVWGIMPLEEGISFESHLSSAVVGIVCALLFRKKDLSELPASVDIFDEDELTDDDDEYWK